MTAIQISSMLFIKKSARQDNLPKKLHITYVLYIYISWTFLFQCHQHSMSSTYRLKEGIKADTTMCYNVILLCIISEKAVLPV